MIVIQSPDSSMAQLDNPPAYADAVRRRPDGKDASLPVVLDPFGGAVQLGSPSGVASGVNLNQNIPETPLMPATPVYHYTNSTTNEHVASLLPPDHPEMLCLQEGVHVPETKFGILGMLAAIFWFPLGIGICMLDRRVKCTRCGFVIDDGICK